MRAYSLPTSETSKLCQMIFRKASPLLFGMLLFGLGWLFGQSMAVPILPTMSKPAVYQVRIIRADAKLRRIPSAEEIMLSQLFDENQIQVPVDVNARYVVAAVERPACPFPGH